MLPDLEFATSSVHAICEKLGQRFIVGMELVRDARALVCMFAKDFPKWRLLEKCHVSSLDYLAASWVGSIYVRRHPYQIVAGVDFVSQQHPKIALVIPFALQFLVHMYHGDASYGTNVGIVRSDSSQQLMGR